MFAYCTSVKTIEINLNATYFPQGCFAYCTNLTSIKLPERSIIYRLESHCFLGCFSLQKLEFNNQLEIVGTNCFQECSSLIEVDLSRLHKIPISCFKKCGQSNINLHLGTNLNMINREAYMDSQIVEFICPENLIIIDEYAFSNCTSLINFIFNEKIRKICYCSFYNVGITELYIPNSLIDINTTSFQKSSHIEFKFSSEGHPIYYVENDCFMNKTGGLMFILWKKRSLFELPSKVKVIGRDGILDLPISKLIINSDISDSEFFDVRYISNICIKSPSYITYSIEDCRMDISDENNIDRYAKEGKYEPTYKLSNSLYIGESYFHIDEQITSSTVYDYANQSLPFLENYRTYSSIHVILLVFISILTVIILILSIISLKITHE